MPELMAAPARSKRRLPSESVSVDVGSRFHCDQPSKARNRVPAETFVSAAAGAS